MKTQIENNNSLVNDCYDMNAGSKRELINEPAPVDYEGKLLELLSNALIFEPLVLWLLGNRINNMKTREGKVLRVLPSGRWVPQNKKIMDGTYLSRIGDAVSSRFHG